MSHDVDLTSDDDEVYVSFIFSSSGPVRIAIGARDGDGHCNKLHLSDHLPYQSLLALKAALDLMIKAHYEE